jgi:hypothetical protein
MKKSKRDGFPKGDLFAMVPYALMDSAAWQTLNPRAVWVYLRLLRTWENGIYSLPLNSLKGLCGHDQVRKGLDDLMEAGFVERIGPSGGLNQLKVADKYRLSEKWKVRSKALELDAEAGVQSSRLQKDGTKFYFWIPKKKARSGPSNLPKSKKMRPGKWTEKGRRIAG